jgi:hypothetical protein
MAERASTPSSICLSDPRAAGHITLILLIPFESACFKWHKKEPARTTPIASKPLTKALTALTQALGSIQFLSSSPEDCEPSVEPEDFGKGGVGVEVEAENRRQRGSVRDGAPKLVDGPNSALVRWSKEKTSLKGRISHELGCHGC